MKVFLFLAIALAGTAHADKVDSQCNIAKCEAGDIVKSYASKSEPFYACPTKELSDYTNFVLGALAMHATMVGKMPSISPTTGEPEYEGKTKDLMDYMRKQAKVRTFDEALTYCQAGRNASILTVANSKKDEQSMWVFDDKRKISYWMPKSAANKIK